MTPPKLDFIQTLAVAGLVLALGGALRRWIPVLARYNLPGPVVGGLVVSVFMALGRTDGVLPIQFDTLLQTPLMIAFFTTLGFGASLRSLREGGPQVAVFLAACTGLAVLQNLIGAGVAAAFGLPPLLGVLAGSVTLTGGPGTGMAFASAFQEAGVPAAATVAVTAAMGGIVLGGLLGGPLGTLIIERRQLHAAAGARATAAEHKEATHAPAADLLVRHLVIILACMWLGGYVSQLFSAAGVTLPAYIGAMLVAGVLRNVDDARGWLRLDHDLLDHLGNLSLAFFLALALMSLKLWELAQVALPLVIILVAQATAMVVAGLGMFRFMGRDYEAAIMSAGMVGFMMGTTANAMANMDALTRRYGPAPRAYLVVPLVGACFIDFTNSVLITACLNLAR